MKKYTKMSIDQKVQMPINSTSTEGKSGKITLIQYNNEVKHLTIVSIDELERVKFLPDYKWWIVVEGVKENIHIQRIGKLFDLRAVTIDNIQNTSIRPSIDVYQKYATIISKKLDFDTDEDVDVEQISLVMGSNYLITFTETNLEQFNQIYNRIKEDLIPQKDISFLTYQLLDSIVDQYFVVMEQIADYIEEVEVQIINKPTKQAVEEIYQLKKELLLIQKLVWPQREIINAIIRDKEILRITDIAEYFRDLNDNLFQVMDMVEIQRDMLTGLLDMYLSSQSQRMNEIMKVLTIISTIFMPLSFLAGVYGMNFQHMPELTTTYGYYVLLGVMAFIGFGMGIYFKIKKWF